MIDKLVLHIIIRFQFLISTLFSNINMNYGIIEHPLKNGLNLISIIELFYFIPQHTPGYSLFFEFPDQVTGQDPRPAFMKNTSTTHLNRIDQIRFLWI